MEFPLVLSPNAKPPLDYNIGLIVTLKNMPVYFWRHNVTIFTSTQQTSKLNSTCPMILEHYFTSFTTTKKQDTNRTWLDTQAMYLFKFISDVLNKL